MVELEGLVTRLMQRSIGGDYLVPSDNCLALLQDKVGKVTLLTRRKLESVDQVYGVDIAGEETAGRLHQHVEGILLDVMVWVLEDCHRKVTPSSCMYWLHCIILHVIVTAMQGGCNYFAVQVHYFIWQYNTIGGHNTVCC